MTARSLALIANPAAGLGLGARRLAAARSALEAEGACAVWVTREPGDEVRCAAEALAAGADTICVLGGDGTWSRVAAVLAERRATARFVPLAAGSGNDFAESLELPAGDVVAMASLARHAGDRRVDAGVVDGRYFFNAAGIGLDVAVLESLERTRWLSGRARYAAAAIRPLFTYAAFSASVAFDALPAPTRDLLAVVVCNGRRFGGMLQVAPSAEVDDGQLDVVTVGAASLARRLALFAAATRGRHIGQREIELRRVSRCVVGGNDRPSSFELDGERYPWTGNPLEFRCVHHALRVVARA